MGTQFLMAIAHPDRNTFPLSSRMGNHGSIIASPSRTNDHEDRLKKGLSPLTVTLTPLLVSGK